MRFFLEIEIFGVSHTDRGHEMAEGFRLYHVTSEMLSALHSCEASIDVIGGLLAGWDRPTVQDKN